MNKREKNIFAMDVEIPEIVQQKAELAFLKIHKKGNEDMKNDTIVNYDGKKTGKNKIAVKKSNTDLEINMEESPLMPSLKAPNIPIPLIENIKTTNKYKSIYSS